MKITLRSLKKLELLKRVQDLEKRGFSCVSPITEVRTNQKVFNRQIDDWRVKNKFAHTEEYVSYVCVMECEEYVRQTTRTIES